jgi:predicted nucleotidyltransferase
MDQFDYYFTYLVTILRRKEDKKMRATGIVVEYNPFHNGHLYHLQKSRENTNADVVIAVMSGSFLQRGEPALLPKWERTKMAIHAGVDILLELPYAFSTQKAEIFAQGSIEILSAIGCDAFCFGSEDGNVSRFSNTHELIYTHQENYQLAIRSGMKAGLSYPQALSEAFHTLHPDQECVDLTSPNNILGYHYIEANRHLDSPMEEWTVKRESSGYHDTEFSSETIASATSIRKALLNPDTPLNTQSVMPSFTYDRIESYKKNYNKLHEWENYWPTLKYQLLLESDEMLATYYEVEEGIEHRLKRAALNSSSFSEFMLKVKTKRYTWTRIQRMCVHILTKATKVNMAKASCKVTYMRLLGMSSAGRIYLNERKKSLTLPLLTKAAELKSFQVYLDIAASRAYSLGLDEPHASELLKKEYSFSPYIGN